VRALFVWREGSISSKGGVCTQLNVLKTTTLEESHLIGESHRSSKNLERKRVVKGLNCELCGLWNVIVGLWIVEEVIWRAGGEGLN
jgi:hypothetical protein